MAHAQLARALVHARRERVFGARDAFGERDRGVVARGDEEAAQQVLDADLRIHLREHAGAARFRVALLRGARRDRQFVLEMEPAFGDFAKDDLGGENFRRRRRRHRRVGVFGEQDRSGVEINEQRERRLGLERRRLGGQDAGQRR